MELLSMKSSRQKNKKKILYQDEASYIANLPGIIVVKDLDYLVTAITNDCARLCGFKNFEQALGHIDHDMPSKIAEIADEFLKLDKQSVSLNKKLHAIQVLNYDSEWRVILSVRTPIVNENNEVVKLHLTAIDITDTNLSRGILLLGSSDKKIINMVNQQANYIIDSCHQPFNLTEKQEVCLFLLVRGKTMKQIANIMKISIKTIEDHINSIKTKLNCTTKSQLIEKAINSGFFYYIPNSSLTKTI